MTHALHHFLHEEDPDAQAPLELRLLLLETAHADQARVLRQQLEAGRRHVNRFRTQ